MLCSKCFQENEDNALFCKHCGSKLPNGGWPDGKTSNMLLHVWVIVLAVTTIWRLVISICVDGYYYSLTWEILYSALSILASLANILPAFVIKDRTMKIVAIVIVCLLTVGVMVGNVMNIIKNYCL